MKQISSETGICHFLTDQSATLKSFLMGLELHELNLQVSPELVEDWLYTGSVYLNGQRQRSDVGLEAGQTLRLHTRRKRYPAAEIGDWQSRIVEDNDNFIVFDKPSGLPTHPTLDNYLENALFVLQQELATPLFTTHRLDIPTAGLLIFARNAKAQAAINREFAKGRVEKIYYAYTAHPVSLGQHTHYINPETRVPRTIDSEPQSNWWECRLEVESQEAVPRGWRHRVRLLTGKTHQIRAQFAALGSPILGDITYGGIAGEFGLKCCSLSFRLFGTPYTVKLTPEIFGL